MELTITGTWGSDPRCGEVALSLRDSLGRLSAQASMLQPTGEGVPALTVDDACVGDFEKHWARHGDARLRVRIESDDPAFLALDWERWPLPGTSVALGERAAVLTRAMPRCKRDAELELGLSVARPLQVRHLVSRPDLPLAYERETHLFRELAGLAALGPGVQVQPLLERDWQAIRSRLCTGGIQQVQVLRYDGPVRVDGGGAMVACDSGPAGQAEWLGARAFGAMARTAGAALVMVSTPLCFDGAGRVDAPSALALLACALLDEGVPAVVVLRTECPPWVGGPALAEVLAQACGGLAVQDAVAQAAARWTVSQEVAARPLLYANQDVCLFEGALPRATGEPGPQAPAVPHQHLHGFLPGLLAPQLPAGTDGGFVAALSLLHGGKRLRIEGLPGQGKTYLAHLLATQLCSGCDRAFYFDFTDGFFTAAEMAQMIAPVLGVRAEDVPHTLEASRHVLVLDSYLARSAGGVEPSAQDVQELECFLEGLGSSNVLIFTGEAARRSGLRDVQIFRLPRLSSEALTYLTTQPSGPANGRANDPAYRALMAQADGNPWLAQRIAAQWGHVAADRLQADMQALSSDAQQDPVMVWYAQQWQRLPPSWRRWALVAMEHPGLFLEVFGASLDAGGPGLAASAWLAVDGDARQPLAAGLELLERAGFVERRAWGHVFERRSLRFLAGVRDADRPPSDADVSLSAFACESFVLVMGHLQRQDHPAVSSNVLGSRHHLARHMERLWTAQRWSNLDETLRQVEAFFTPRGLGPELSQWARALLTRLPAPARPVAEDESLAACWLRLCGLALRGTQKEGLGCLAQARAAFDGWLRRQDPAEAGRRPALYSASVDFLQRCAKVEESRGDILHLADHALKAFRVHEVWPLVARQLLLSASCLFEQGERTAALARHAELLDLLQREGALPAAQRGQVRMQLLVQRLQQGVADGTQPLLDHCRREAGSQPAPLLEFLQADLWRLCGERDRARAGYQSLAGRMPTAELEAQRQSRLEALNGDALQEPASV
ncbi:MAG: hypothetical protein JF607_16210 [Burkholderiales bacterium]|nr:hypothetical protein [Burkholderiales bacterium]